MRSKVLVGVITGAHGIRGEVKLKSFMEEPQAIARYSPLETPSGVRIEIARLRSQKDGFIAVLKGVADRNGAEALKGTELYLPRERLPEPAADETYIHDLIGLEVSLKDGSRFGKIVNVVNFGAGDLLDVKVEGRKDSVLIPYASRFVIEKDLAAGTIIMELPDGFLDEDVPPDN